MFDAGAGPEQLDGGLSLGLAPSPIGNLVGGRGFGEVELRGRHYRGERTGGREEKEIIVFFFKIYVIKLCNKCNKCVIKFSILLFYKIK